jgi:hypothetical protein
MSLLPFREWPSFQARRFIPANMNLGEWSQVAPFFDRLETHSAQCATVFSAKTIRPLVQLICNEMEQR